MNKRVFPAIADIIPKKLANITSVLAVSVNGMALTIY